MKSSVQLEQMIDSKKLTDWFRTENAYKNKQTIDTMKPYNLALQIKYNNLYENQQKMESEIEKKLEAVEKNNQAFEEAVKSEYEERMTNRRKKMKNKTEAIAELNETLLKIKKDLAETKVSNVMLRQERILARTIIVNSTANYAKANNVEMAEALREVIVKDLEVPNDTRELAVRLVREHLQLRMQKIQSDQTRHNTQEAGTAGPSGAGAGSQGGGTGDTNSSNSGES